jgi:CHAT domain-containing protein
MGIVENASEDLPYTAYECQTLATQYDIAPNQRLQRHQATAAECQKLAKQVQILHLSHHASANRENSLDSQLTMHDRAITLREIMTWRIITLLEVYLNNCETHYSIADISDNILTIATGFLCAGARSVISTLWSVDDCSSALLALFYYDLRHAGLSRSQALQQAQQKLRTLTGQELQQTYYQQLDQHLQQQFEEALLREDEAKKNYNLAPKDSPEAQKWTEASQKTKDFAEKLAYQRQQVLPNMCQQPYPFANPFYWAGFISQGLA